MFYQMLLSPEVKRCAIITYKHGMYEFLNNLDLESQKIRKHQESV